jgi:hypothetical protein
MPRIAAKRLQLRALVRRNSQQCTNHARDARAHLDLASLTSL